MTRIICGVQAKVGPGIRSAAVANLGQLAVPNLGPRGGPKFGTAGTKNIKAGPKLSPSDGARFGPQFDQTKAMTMYPWLNFALAPPHRPPLCLNMDETALIRHPTGLRGYGAKVSGPNCIAADKSSLADRRCYMTYLACVADDPSIQPKLPQVLLGNEHQLTLETMRSIADDLPRSIMVWRQKTSWNSKATMRRWLTILATALGDVVKEG